MFKRSLVYIFLKECKNIFKYSKENEDTLKKSTEKKASGRPPPARGVPSFRKVYKRPAGGRGSPAVGGGDICSFN
jgi:hypothetical protein